ncbi:MAG: bifunctional serine/threonine-protein kinase/formylglycine-generating enzyme family protein [Acidobacteria bacterium]|nr:bifunctional serine/threonine-protein kinase/formylglycine-generating enzyme family protein [Acidobacteriota bacterium]
MPKANDRIGPYQLIRKLGEGGFGEVWLAQDFSGSNSREVAVKMPLKSEIDLNALLQEAASWMLVPGHPNVLEFIATRVFDGQIVLVSGYAPDGSLKDWLRRSGGRASSVEAAVEMTLGILAGLEHLHKRNIIHGDVRPDNVLLLGETLRLADFGLSRVLKSTSNGAAGASRAPYMAPETFNRKHSQQTDLWSVGVMLYQMLSGRLPFDGADPTDLHVAICNEEPEPLTAAPRWLQEVVAKALGKDPQQRYQTTEEMRAALTEQQPAIEEEPAPPLYRTVAFDETLLRHEPNSPIPVRVPPLQHEPSVIYLQPPRPKPIGAVSPRAKPVSPTPQKRLSGKLLIGGAAAALVIALAAYLMTKSATSPVPATTSSPPIAGQTFTENLNGVKLEMIGAPAGSFLMGSPENESGRTSAEGPQHRVNVKAFSIGKYEVAQALWKAVMDGKNPSKFKGDDLPVENVSWNDAKEFCQKLSQITGKPYRLPSEAEWEYASRSKTKGTYPSHLTGMAWYSSNSRGKTQPVGKKLPNAFELYDMHGNVWEWCEDVWHKSYGGQSSDPPSDGRAWLTGGEQNFRALRGGSWNNDLQGVRSAFRVRGAPGIRAPHIGFRVVVSARSQ